MHLGPEVQTRIAAPGGQPDLALSAPLSALRTFAPQSHMAATTMIHLIDGQWHQTMVQSNTLSFGQRLFPRNVRLSHRGGPLSQLLDGLGASTPLRLDVVRDAQMVLNLPTPLKAFDPA